LSWQRALRNPEKMFRSIIYEQLPTIWCKEIMKIGPLYPEKIDFQVIFEKRKLTQAKHTARRTSLPGGVNKI